MFHLGDETCSKTSLVLLLDSNSSNVSTYFSSFALYFTKVLVNELIFNEELNVNRQFFNQLHARLNDTYKNNLSLSSFIQKKKQQ